MRTITLKSVGRNLFLGGDSGLATRYYFTVTVSNCAPDTT
jgi:hypothetical protein